MAFDDTQTEPLILVAVVGISTAIAGPALQYAFGFSRWTALALAFAAILLSFVVFVAYTHWSDR
ncbi:hypothetical protein N9Y42_06855 [Mariniblastus sp.]|nr:hypothetical protein [Mariniblastus sp.]